MKKTLTQPMVLFLWALVLVSMVVVVTMTASIEDCRFKDEKQTAALLMEEAITAIKTYRIEHNIALTDPTRNNQSFDRLETGLLGYWLTPITTTSGSLEAKRTTINPNFAAVIVDMFKNASIQKGDEVGIFLTGSFPALNFAVMAAVEAFELKPYIMVSVGASSFGANIPDWTYFDMHQFLYEESIWQHPVDLVSLGGENDVATDLNQDIISAIESRIEAANITFLKEADYHQNIQMRMQYIYDALPNMAIFINVGGNMISLGINNTAFIKKNGLITKSKKIYSEDRGLIDRYLELNKPVIHLLQVESLALQYQLPLDPVVFPVAGEGSIYTEKTYAVWLLVITLVIGIAPIGYITYQGKQKNKNKQTNKAF